MAPKRCSSQKSMNMSPSKRQKISEAVTDTEQLNDVTVVSGINLREEQEQLFSGPREGIQVLKSSQRVVQEEEKETLILQRIPLQRKLEHIMSKFGISSIGKDVERCLSLCVEERMHRLICNMIRTSKQRVDFEKTRHQTLVTSDVGHQIVVMNGEVQDREKQQAEEPGGVISVGGDMDKDADCSETSKANEVKRKEDMKLHKATENVADLGDDLTSKLQTHDDTRTVRLISIKDVIAVLQKEPQMSKSTLITCLIDRVNANAASQ